MKTAFAEGFLNTQAQYWLADFGYSFEHPRTDDYRFTLHHRLGTFRSQIIVYEAELVASVFVYVTDDLYEAGRAPFVEALANRLTKELVFGAFLFDDKTGSVCFRDAAVIKEPDAFPSLLHRTSFPIELWRQGFLCWQMPKATPEYATRLALAMTGLNDSGVSKMAMQGILSVTKGRASSESEAQPSVRLRLLKATVDESR